MAKIDIRRPSQVNPAMLESVDYGLLCQNIPLAEITGSTALGTSGTVYVCKLRTRKTITVTNIHMFVTVAIGTPTAGQNFVALYDSSKNLLAQSSDQSTAWGSTGMQTMALSAPKTVAPGTIYVAVWSNATTRPTFRCGVTGSSSINGINSAANSLWATADTGVTTTAPSTLGTYTAYTNALWVGLS